MLAFPLTPSRQCCINALLWLLYAQYPAVRDPIVQAPPAVSPDLVDALRSVFKQIRDGVFNDMDALVNVNTAVWRHCGKWEPGAQQDVHELLIRLLAELRRIWTSRFGVSLSEDTHVYQAVRQLVPCECAHVPQHATTDLCIDLSTVLAATLQEAIDEFFLEELVVDYTCAACNAKKLFARHVSVPQPPKRLTLQLKRFGSGGNKLQEHIDLGNGQALFAGALYRVTAAVVHAGNAVSSGHYYALIAIDNERWALLDDAKEPVVVASVQALNASGDAYVLGLVRVDVLEFPPLPRLVGLAQKPAVQQQPAAPRAYKRSSFSTSSSAAQADSFYMNTTSAPFGATVNGDARLAVRFVACRVSSTGVPWTTTPDQAFKSVRSLSTEARE